MSFEPRDYLRHIVVEADYLIAQTTGLERDEFMANETLQRAFVRSLEIVGEAAKKVPEDFRAKHPAVEWRALAGMRDRLIHDYFGGSSGCDPGGVRRLPCGHSGAHSRSRLSPITNRGVADTSNQEDHLAGVRSIACQSDRIYHRM